MIVYDGSPWFKVHKNNVKNYIGETINDYHFVECKDSALACIYCTVTEKILLLNEFKPGLNKVCFTLPGGMVEQDETGEDALKREVYEEINFKISEFKFIQKIINHGNYNFGNDLVYLCKINSTQLKITPNEIGIVKAKFYSLEEINSLIHKKRISISGVVAALNLVRIHLLNT